MAGWCQSVQAGSCGADRRMTIEDAPGKCLSWWENQGMVLGCSF